MGSRSNSDNKRVEVFVRQKPDKTYEATGKKRVTIPVKQKGDGTYTAPAAPAMDKPKSGYKFNPGGSKVDLNVTGPHKLKSGKLYE